MKYTFEDLVRIYNEAMNAAPGTRKVYEDVESQELQNYLDHSYPGTGPGYEFVFPNDVKLEVHMHVDENIVDAEVVEPVLTQPDDVLTQPDAVPSPDAEETVTPCATEDLANQETAAE